MDARGPTPTGWVPDALGYALLVAAGVSMGLCRRWPQAAAGVVTAVLAVFVAAFALRNRGQARA
jgi:predicted anti-sigma-YlaC factor YlaD